MGKVVEKTKLTNFADPSKSVEVDALVDTGAVLLALPHDTITRLGLQKLRELTVRYANNSTELRPIYGVVTVEIQGRETEVDVLEVPDGAQPLVGQIVLEQLDLLVDPVNRKVIPNPRSPHMPVIDML